MADLKRIDADALIAHVREAEKDAISMLKAHVAAAIRDVEDAARALADLPKGTAELLEAAVVVQSRDFARLPEFANELVFTTAEFYDGGTIHRLSEQHLNLRLPTGRYRALFFLLPLKD